MSKVKSKMVDCLPRRPERYGNCCQGILVHRPTTTSAVYGIRRWFGTWKSRRKFRAPQQWYLRAADQASLQRRSPVRKPSQSLPLTRRAPTQLTPRLREDQFPCPLDQKRSLIRYSATGTITMAAGGDFKPHVPRLYRFAATGLGASMWFWVWASQLRQLSSHR